MWGSILYITSGYPWRSDTIRPCLLRASMAIWGPRWRLQDFDDNFENLDWSSKCQIQAPQSRIQKQVTYSQIGIFHFGTWNLRPRLHGCCNILLPTVLRDSLLLLLPPCFYIAKCNKRSQDLGFRTSIFGSQDLGFRTSIFGSQDLGFRTSIFGSQDLGLRTSIFGSQDLGLRTSTRGFRTWISKCNKRSQDLGFRPSVFGFQHLGFRPSVFGSQDLDFRTSKALHPTVVLSFSRHFSLRPVVTDART
jgi:hypothetical protein